MSGVLKSVMKAIYNLSDDLADLAQSYWVQAVITPPKRFYYAQYKP